MQGYCEPFEGKKITVLGLGLLGRGVGDVEFLAKCGAHVLVTDKKTEEQLAQSVEKLKPYSNVLFRFGEHREEDFTNCDVVLKGAKTPADSIYIAAARKAGIPILMSTAFFAQQAMKEGARVVGITGTRGKSTVTHMIHHALIRANRKALLGGNVRGVSTLALLPEISGNSICVLELDSWQLQGFGDLNISPQIAVFTNLLPDHLDYYGSTSLTTGQAMERYFSDKANIFKFQKNGDVLFVGEQVLARVRAAKPPVEPIVPPALPDEWQLKVPGQHNRDNAALAAAGLRSLGLSETEIKDGLELFEALEGRLQFVKEVEGVKIYNDNNSTTPEATVAALRAVGDSAQKRVVLIMGGDEKYLDMSELVSEIPKWCSNVVLFKERGTKRIRDDVFALTKQGVAVYEEEGLLATVNRARAVANPRDTILFSPAFTSFGKYFANEYERSAQFIELVRSL